MKLIFAMLLISFATQAKSKSEIIRQISATAKMAHIDPDLAVAIATIESSLNPKAVGGLNEIGLFQLRPEYHNVIPGQVAQNIMVGVSYLSYVKSRCEAKYGSAWFVGFNYGPSCKLKRPKETEYYKKVTRELNRIKVKRYIASN